jgi:hypothetical protein
MRPLVWAAGLLAACQFNAGGSGGDGDDAGAGAPDARSADAAVVPADAPASDFDSAPPPTDANEPPPDAGVDPDPVGLITSGSASVVGDLGGSGGDPFVEDCPDGRVITGFSGKDNMFGLTQLSATCCRLVVGPTGTVSTVDPIATPAHGSETSVIDIDPVECPVNRVVVGFTGSHSAGGLVHHLRIECAPITWDGDGYTIGPSAEVPQNLGSPTGFDQDSGQCASTQVAGGFEGRAGTILDNFKLRCYDLAPVF